MEDNKLKTLQEIYEDIDFEIKQESLNYYLNQQPPEAWIKVHPFIRGYRYLPIDKVEWLLRKFFKKFKIEIKREGSAFNGVYVVVRVWYKDPITNKMDFHEGIGAAEMQTKKGSSAADLANLNSGALSMAFPIAKTVAIKDACDHFGNIFGANLNRKDVAPVVLDEKLLAEGEVRNKAEVNRIKALIGAAKNIESLEKLEEHVVKISENNSELMELFNNKKSKLCKN